MTQPGSAALPVRRSAMLVAGILAMTCGLYLGLLGWHTTDVDWWFVPWMDAVIQRGAQASLATPIQVQVEGANGFANYTPSYLYLLILASAASGLFSSFALVKLVAVGGAVFCAGCIFYLLRGFIGPRIAWPAAAGVLLLPTTALNSAAWGQTDTIWAGLCVLVVAFGLRGMWAAMLFIFGVALAFKLQSIFIAPFVLHMVLSRRVKLHFVLLPLLAYAVMMLPAWLAGRPALDLATVYLDQAGTYQWLSMNAPNPWAFVQYLALMPYGTGVIVGTLVTALAGLALGALAVCYKRLEGVDLLLLAVVVAASMPYLLPKMHDRYFFLADVLAYALAVIRPRPWTIGVAVAIQLGSLGAYAAHMVEFSLGKYIGALFIGLALVVALAQLLRALRPGRRAVAGAGFALG